MTDLDSLDWSEQNTLADVSRHELETWIREAVEADRAQREEEVSPPRQMGSGDMCWFGPEQYQVTHYRCDEYRDGTVTDVRTGMIVTSAPSTNPKGFDR